MFHLHGSPIHHQPRTDMVNQLPRLQPIGLQGIAGIDNIDNLVGQVQNRRQLHRPVELDDIRLPPLGRVIAPRQVHKLGGHADAPRRRLLALLASGHQPAAGNVQIQRLVKPRATVLHQHIFARHAQIGAAVLNVSGHIRGTDNQYPHVRIRGRKHQLAGLFHVVHQLNTGVRQQRQGFFEDSSLRQGDGDGICHGSIRFPVG